MSVRPPQRPVEWVEWILAEPREGERRRLLEQVPAAHRAVVRRAVAAALKRREAGR